MSVETQEVEEVETETVVDAGPSKEEKANAFFDKLENKPTESVADDEVDADEEQQESEPEQPEIDKLPTKVEGPTAAMRAIARQHNVDEELIALAQNDEQLDVLIRHVTKKPEETPAPEPAKEFKLELSEDDFPADDPVRKALTSLQEQFASELKRLDEDNKTLAYFVAQQKEFVERSEQSEHANKLGMFDSELDAFESSALGSRQAGSHNHDLRTVIWNKYWELKEQKPNESDKKLIADAAAVYGQKPKQAIRKDAILKDNGKRLGGGPVKPLPPGELSQEEKLNEFFDRIEAKHKK